VSVCAKKTPDSGLEKRDHKRRLSALYAVQLGEDIWVVHVFQMKSTRGIKTPKSEIDLVKDRMKRLKEMLR
jgi:phage-related protein